MKLEIVQSSYHANAGGEPFVVAIVDDVENDDTKLVIMFEDEGYTAILSLDQIIDEEDISVLTNSWNVLKYEDRLRDELWGNSNEEYEIDL
jgi:hypothetical protein